jgi:hypothetical protein
VTAPSLQPAGRGLPSAARLALGFVAGFLAVLIFHQAVIAGMHAFGLTRGGPFQMQGTWPFGVPRVLSLAFWGGVWGILLVLAEPWFGRGGRYWLMAFIFGALGPTLFGWFVLAPIRGTPVAGGWQLANMWRGPVINGAWGLGTAVILWLFAKAAQRKA